MAQVDTSIYGRPQGIDWAGLNSIIASGQQIANARQRNRLADLALARQQNTDAAYSGAVGADGVLDRNKLLGNLASANLGAEIPAAQQAFAQQDRYASQAQNDRLQQAMNRIQVTGQLLQGVTDEGSYQRALQTAQQYGIPLEGVPQSYDAGWVNQTRQQATSAQQQLENQFRQLGLNLQVERLNRDANNFGAPFQTTQGFYQANSAGNVRPVVGADGQTLVPISADVGLQGQVAQSRARGTEEGKAAAGAAQGYGETEATAQNTLKVIDDLISHPGRERATGVGSYFPSIRGGAARDFETQLEQLQGQTFLQAFESLKGGGAITEVEGQKATQAIANLQISQSDDQFRRNLEDLRTVVQSGLERARRKAERAGSPQAAMAERPASAPVRQAPAAAVEYLRANPGQRQFFDQKYGAGAAAAILGQ